MNRWICIKGLLLTLLLGQFSFGQTEKDCGCLIQGVVKEQGTFQPIIGAVLVIIETGQVAVTDSAGRYKIQKLCQGKYKLECRIVGYKTTQTTVFLQHTTEENIHLNEEEVHLQDVEIIARRAPSLTSQKHTILEGQALTHSQGQTLGDVLKNMSGITMLQTGATITKPVIHGLHSNRVLIMNNGVRQEGQQWGNEHAPEIDPFIAKRITVVRGAAGVRYGADAIGGVVLIEPNELPKQGPIQTEINTTLFSNGRMGVVSGMVEGSIKKWQGLGWRVQGTLKNGGNIQTPHYFLANTGVREQNFSTAIGYRKTDIGVEVFYSQFHTNLGIFSGAHIGSTTDLLEVIQKGEPFIRSDFYRNIEKPNQQINHHLLKIKAFYLLKGNRINLTIGRQFNRRAEYDLHRTTNANQPALLFRLTTHTADLIFEHKPVAKKISGQIGLSSLYQYNFNDGRPLIPDFEQTNMGLFAIERWLHQRWEIEAGLRYDWRKMDIFRFVGNVLNPTEKRFRNASGTLGAVYHAHEMLTFRLNIGSAWRPPNMSELYSKGVHHGAAAYEEGSDALQPEVALNTISSIEYAHPRFRAELGFYYNAIQNFIYLKPQNEPILTIRGAFPYFKYVQTQATFTGLDLDTEWEMIPQKLIHTQKLSYLRGYDIGTDNFLVLIPANRIDNGLSWQFGNVFLWDDVRLSIHHLWVDKQHRTPPNSDFMPSPSAYHLWSIKIAGQLKTLHLQWSIEGQNLLNTAYRDYLNRFRYYALEQGRNLSLRLKWNL